MLKLPADVQSLVAQIVDGSESKITGCLEEIKSKAEEFFVKQLSLRDFIREELESLDKSVILRTQKAYKLSLDIDHRLQDIVQTHNNSTDAALERISNNTIKIQEYQRTEFQALSKSTKRSMDGILRSVLQQESRSQAHSTHIYRKLEHITTFLESVETIRTEVRNQARSPHASKSNITTTAQALFESLWVMWQSLNDVIRQFMLVNYFS